MCGRRLGGRSSANLEARCSRSDGCWWRAHAGWVEDRQDEVNHALADIGVSDSRWAELKANTAELDAARCDVPTAGFSFWDRNCAGSIAAHDPEACGSLAVAAVLVFRLKDLQAGNDRSTQITLTCGGIEAWAGVRKYVPENWDDGRIEVRVRAAGAGSDAPVLFEGSSAAAVGWRLPPPEARLPDSTAVEAVRTYGSAVVDARQPVDAAREAFMATMSTGDGDGEALRGAIETAAALAKQHVGALALPDSDPGLRDAATAYYQAVAAWAVALKAITAAPAGQEPSHAAAQALIDAEGTRLAAADAAYGAAVQAYATRHGF